MRVTGGFTVGRKIALLVLGFAALLPILSPAAVTQAELAAVNAKLKLAIPFFEQVWSQAFDQKGLRFTAPKTVAYTGTISTPCGQIDPGNACFCSKDNTIYLDGAFLADLMKSAARETGTEGDYAAIIVAAHEFGHLLQDQLGTTAWTSFREEQAADCFAGAVTREAANAGRLDPGDLEEAHHSLITSGDHLGGSYLKHLLNKTREGAHGESQDRFLAFHRGFYVGAKSCSPALGTPAVPPAGRVVFQDNFARSRPQGTAACSVTPVNGELVVTNTGKQADEICEWSLGSSGALPDNFRIEVSMRQLKGTMNRGAGLYFGPPPRAAAKNFAGAVRAEGSWVLYEIWSPVERPDFLGDSQAGPASPVQAGYGKANRLTLDVHRQQGGATILFYVNGQYVGMNAGSFGWIDRTAKRDERIGLFLQNPGMSAAFSDFRMMTLRD